MITLSRYALPLTSLLMVWGQVHAQSIYSCTDAKGRKITADRPIAECMDRDQTELSGNGTVKRVIKPSMTEDEREAYEEKIRQELQEQNRRSEERRKNRALLTRYPNKAVHDKERQEAIASLESATQVAQLHLRELQTDAAKLQAEMEFYQKDPSKAPPKLRRSLQDNQASLEAQLRFLESQTQEVQRINNRFDLELVTLKQLWTRPANAAATSKGK